MEVGQFSLEFLPGEGALGVVARVGGREVGGVQQDGDAPVAQGGDAADEDGMTRKGLVRPGCRDDGTSQADGLVEEAEGQSVA